MKKDKKIVVHVNQCYSLGNINSDDYKFAKKYVNKVMKEFNELKATELDMDDIYCAVLSGISYGKDISKENKNESTNNNLLAQNITS